MLVILFCLSLLMLGGFPFLLGWPRFLVKSGSERGERDLSVIVPARDEEANIGGLLESLRGDCSPLEVIVVNDGSTDATAEVARGGGAQVVTPRALPEGWKGKPWACQEGAHEAQGEWLLFLDADVRMEEEGLQKLGELFAQEGRVFSFCPYHEQRAPWEGLSAFFNVLMVAGADAFGVHRGRKKETREQLFGQSLLIRKTDYKEIGGHKSVAGEVLENFHLAPTCREHGLNVRSYLGKGVMKMRMFDEGVGELWRSWKKGFTQGAAQVAPSVLLTSSLWISGLMMVIVGVALWFLLGGLSTGGWSSVLTLLAYLMGVGQCAVAFRLVGNYPWWLAVIFPLPLLFYQVLFFTALIEKKRGHKTVWKGRHVD